MTDDEDVEELRLRAADGYDVRRALEERDRYVALSGELRFSALLGCSSVRSDEVVFRFRRPSGTPLSESPSLAPHVRAEVVRGLMQAEARIPELFSRIVPSSVFVEPTTGNIWLHRPIVGWHRANRDVATERPALLWSRALVSPVSDLGGLVLAAGFTELMTALEEAGHVPAGSGEVDLASRVRWLRRSGRDILAANPALAARKFMDALRLSSDTDLVAMCLGAAARSRDVSLYDQLEGAIRGEAGESVLATPEVAAARAWRLYKRDAFSESEPLARSAIASRHDDELGLRVLRDLLERSGRLPEAAELSCELVKRFPSRERLAGALALIGRARRPDLRRAAFEAYSLPIAEAGILLHRARLELEEGDSSRALATLTTLASDGQGVDERIAMETVGLAKEACARRSAADRLERVLHVVQALRSRLPASTALATEHAHRLLAMNYDKEAGQEIRRLPAGPPRARLEAIWRYRTEEDTGALEAALDALRGGVLDDDDLIEVAILCTGKLRDRSSFVEIQLLGARAIAHSATLRKIIERTAKELGLG